MRVVIYGVAVLLVACAGSVPNEKGLREEAARAAQQSGRSAAQALTQVDSDIGSAKQDGLLFYAPRHMKLAIDAIETARKMQKGNMAERAQLEAIITAETALKRARDVQKNVLTVLATALKTNAELVQIHTHQSLPDAYLKNLSDLKELIDEVEAGKLDNARKDLNDYIADSRQLEINTHLHQQLQRAREAFNDADKIDSDDNAPQSLLLTQQAITAAENTIKQSPRNFDAMNKAGFVAWQEAQHLLALCQEMIQLRTQLKLNKVEGADFEKILLLQEKQLQEGFAALPLPTPRHLAVHAQQQQLVQAIQLLRDNQALTYQQPMHIDLRYPANALTIDNVLPKDYLSWLGDSTLLTQMTGAVAPAATVNAAATVQTVSAPIPQAKELPPLAPTNNSDEDELQKAIEAEQKK